MATIDQFQYFCQLNKNRPGFGQRLMKTYGGELAPGIKPPLIWFEANACSGDSISTLNTTEPELGQILCSLVEVRYWNALIPDQGRQAMLGAEFLQNHIRHFYLLALPDYLDSGMINQSPVPAATPNENSRFNEPQQRILVEHYFAAMEASKKAHDMLAVFGGKIPHQRGLAPSGVAVYPDADRRKQFLSLLQQIREFIVDIMVPDAYFLAEVYPDYFLIGAGLGRFINFGLFDPFWRPFSTGYPWRGRVETSPSGRD